MLMVGVKIEKLPEIMLKFLKENGLDENLYEVIMIEIIKRLSNE